MLLYLLVYVQLHVCLEKDLVVWNDEYGNGVGVIFCC